MSDPRYVLITDYGTLTLPSWYCYGCIASGQYCACTACPFQTEIKQRASAVLKQVEDKIINTEEEE